MTHTVELVRPGIAFLDSYGGLVAEFAEAGEKFVPFVLAFDHRDFDALLRTLADCSRGIGLPDGFVSHSTYWLVQNRSEVVGVTNIRHTLTAALRREGGNIGYGIRPSARRRGLGTAILRHALDRAAALGLDRVLVTCAKTNIGSVKAILRNRGKFDSEAFLPDRDEIVQRYWISTNDEVLG